MWGYIKLQETFKECFIKIRCVWFNIKERYLTTKSWWTWHLMCLKEVISERYMVLSFSYGVLALLCIDDYTCLLIYVNSKLITLLINILFKEIKSIGYKFSVITLIVYVCGEIYLIVESSIENMCKWNNDTDFGFTFSFWL